MNLGRKCDEIPVSIRIHAYPAAENLEAFPHLFGQPGIPLRRLQGDSSAHDGFRMAPDHRPARIRRDHPGIGGHGPEGAGDVLHGSLPRRSYVSAVVCPSQSLSRISRCANSGTSESWRCHVIWRPSSAGAWVVLQVWMPYGGRCATLTAWTHTMVRHSGS